MQVQATYPHIVVVGGGFAGIEIIKTLLRYGGTARITLISKSDTFEYYPALYKLVTGAIPLEVSMPLADIFPRGVELISGTYTGIDQSRQVITFKSPTDVVHEVAYDYAVLALGSETNYFNIPGLPEFSFSFKSVKEALRLKRHFCALFGAAVGKTKEELVEQLHVAIVGGGPSGVELAGDLRSYLTDVAHEYNVDQSLVTIDLIEAGNRVLPTMSEKISRIAEARLRKMGVNILVNRALMSQDEGDITLKDMQMKSQTVIWTAGTRINTAYSGFTLDERKRVAVSATLTLPGDNHVFIAGDGAGTPYSGLAQTAIHNGRYIGTAITRMIEGKEVQPYTPARPSFIIPIGRYWALLSSGKLVLTGLVPRLLRLIIDFKYLSSIVPFSRVLHAFEIGKKYRRVHGGCDLDPETIE